MTLTKFKPAQIEILNNTISVAEELVANYYKISAAQWRRHKYDIETLSDLATGEIIAGPFAQIIRYEGRQKGKVLGSSSFDFYKICIQDNTILEALRDRPRIRLYPFLLYIITHEMIHVIRFIKFLQNFDASPEEKLAEEARVHGLTREILEPVFSDQMEPVFEFYQKWSQPLENLNTNN
jgi:hypothetical protein